MAIVTTLSKMLLPFTKSQPYPKQTKGIIFSAYDRQDATVWFQPSLLRWFRKWQIGKVFFETPFSIR
jgi:hypothetical protein